LRRYSVIVAKLLFDYSDGNALAGNILTDNAIAINCKKIQLEKIKFYYR